MRHLDAEFSGSVRGSAAVATLSGSFSGSHQGLGEELTQIGNFKYSASFGLGMVSFSFDGTQDQIITLDTSSEHFISGARATLSGSLLKDVTIENATVTGSFSGSFTGLISGSLTSALTSSRVAYALTGGLGIEPFRYVGDSRQHVQLDTASAHFTVGVSQSQAALLTTLSASFSTSQTALSSSASTSRTALSSSLTTTDQTISSSVAALSASAASALTAYSASEAADDTAYSASAATALTNQSASAASALTAYSASEAVEDTQMSASFAAYITGSTYRENVTGATTYNINHNLNEIYPIIQSYNTVTNLQTIPSSVTSVDADNLTVSYASAFTGIIIVQR